MVTLLDERYEYLKVIEPGRAGTRAAGGLAEWVTASGTTPNTRFGTLRMLPRQGRRVPSELRPHPTLLLAPDGVPIMRLSADGKRHVRDVLVRNEIAAETHGGCIVLLQPIDPARRRDVVLALGAGVADSVGRRAALRREVEEVLQRAGVPNPAHASDRDLNRIVRVLFADLQIRQDATVAEIIVLLGRTGEVLGKPEIETQPDMYRLRALLDRVHELNREHERREANGHDDNEATGGRIEDTGAKRTGHGGGRQSVAVAQAYAAVGGQ